MNQWVEWVTKNPQYLQLEPNIDQEHEIEALFTNDALNQIGEYLQPIKVLQQRLSRENFIIEQEKQFPSLIDKCLRSANYSFFAIGTFNGSKRKVSISLHDNLLFIAFPEREINTQTQTSTSAHTPLQKYEKPLILTPTSLENLLISYFHLKAHGGIAKVLFETSRYYFPSKYAKIQRFISCCFGCFLQNRLGKKGKIGFYPVPTYPMEIITFDLAENVAGRLFDRKYNHILVCVCMLTDFTLLSPIVKKDSATVQN